MSKCSWWVCSKERTAKSPFCSKGCANKHRVDLRRREVKYRLVVMAGGKCGKCGYNKCLEALEFHHRDRTLKATTLGSGNTPAWSLLAEEVKKCDLLCSNCHRELEAEPFEERWEIVRHRVESGTVRSLTARKLLSIDKDRARTKLSAAHSRVTVSGIAGYKK